jgi:hypothetical protein
MIEEGFAEATTGRNFEEEKNENPTATLAFGDFHFVQGTPFQSLTLPMQLLPTKKGRENFGFIFVFLVSSMRLRL